MPIALIAAAYLGYGLVSERLRSTVITAPMVFVGLGLLLGPIGLGLVSTGSDESLATGIFELTLILVLFSDAFAIDGPRLIGERKLPIRLLGIGLPLTIGLGWALAALMFTDLDIWEAALIGAVLAPTDASLAQSVIVDRRVPRPVRDGLNVESGLNDGIALPFVIIFLGLAGESGGEQQILEIFMRALVLSALIGGLAGWLGGRLLAAAGRRGWMSATWRPLALLSTALIAYEAAALVEGSGFIAAWVAGLAAGMTVRREMAKAAPELAADASAREASSSAFIDGLGVLLTTASYFVFGALLLGPQLETLTLPVIVFAILALTFVRMVPVAISLIRARFGRPSILFVGWFGPRGLASIVFTVLIVEEALPGVPLITSIVVATVGLSILAHGLTSAWAARRYGAWYTAAAERDPSIPEAEEVADVASQRRMSLAGVGRADPTG
jgi:NhaP-type Na+/H+ or K+/H+ antiporter